MQINTLFIKHGIIFRVLAITDSKALIINCFENKMPYWENIELLDAYDTVTESELLETANIVFPPYDSLPPNLVGHMHKKYGTISLIIPHLKSDAERNSAIEICAKKFDVSKATIRHRLCQYLTFQDVRIFLPTSKASEKPLSDDEKNFRWALNKYYYSAIKIPLTETYILDKKPYRKSCFSTLQRKEERFFCDFWRSSVYI